MRAGRSPEQVAERIRQALRQRRYREVLENPPEQTLAQLRRSCQRSQESMAASLGVRQIQVSRLERRHDLRLSSLRAYVGSLGGTLELIVRLPLRAAKLLIGGDGRRGTPARSRARR